MKPERTSYDHRYHAANVGDVWKHVALIAWLSRARDARPASSFIDTHAGRGAYELAPTGEHTEGLGLLRDRQSTHASVRRYLELAASRTVYPGSPKLALSVLDRAEDRFTLFELDRAAHAELSRNIQDPRATIKNDDGLAGVLDAIDDHSCVLIDPPYQDRKEWEHVPDAIAAALQQTPRAQILLWYPIKSYARPNAMHARLEKAGLAGTALELLTSPLESKKNRLNGSGIILINAETTLIEELSATAVHLGPRLALRIAPHEAYWSTRAVGFGTGTGSS